jgi:hypothetical protein
MTATFHPALTSSDRISGKVVFGRHPLTGEKYPLERYTIASVGGSMTDGETIVIVDDTGEESESSSQFLCR